MATGCSQVQLAISFRVSPSSVGNILREVTSAIVEEMEMEHLLSPSYATWMHSEEIFRNKWNFPFCVGAIDGKHVRIKCPWNSGSRHYNYKGYFSVVVLAVVGGDYK